MTDDELRQILEDLQRETIATRQESAANRSEVAAFRQEFRSEIAAVREENAAEHENSRRKIEMLYDHVDDRFDLLAEGQQMLHEKLDRTKIELEERMDREFGETRAMIKFSPARVQRIESGTH